MRQIKLTLMMTCLCISLPLFPLGEAASAASEDTISDYLEEYNNNYPGPIEFQRTPDPSVASPLPTNADQTLLYPNQDEPSLEQSHNQTMRASLMDNRTAALNTPNQNQPSNQEIIRNRLSAMQQ
jgi:hypothetical protein